MGRRPGVVTRRCSGVRWRRQHTRGRRWGAGVGGPAQEVEAQEEWRWPGRPSGLGRNGGPGQFGCSAETKEEFLSEF
jgi:hypothetical protein